MFKNNRLFGDSAENLVLEYYLDKGYELITKNYEYRMGGVQGRMGEIDLIFSKNKIVYLVEVKARSSDKFGKIEEQITYQKLKYLHRAYKSFLMKYRKFLNYNAQCDIAMVKNEVVSILENSYSFDLML